MGHVHVQALHPECGLVHSHGPYDDDDDDDNDDDDDDNDGEGWWIGRCGDVFDVIGRVNELFDQLYDLWGVDTIIGNKYYPVKIRSKIYRILEKYASQ